MTQCILFAIEAIGLLALIENYTAYVVFIFFLIIFIITHHILFDIRFVFMHLEQSGYPSWIDWLFRVTVFANVATLLT